MLGTKHCDRCHEVVNRVSYNPLLAARVLRELPVDGDKYTAAIDKLYEWQHCHGTSFSCLVFDLCCKADPANQLAIQLAWPHLWAAWKIWRESRNSDDFFRSHGFTIK